MIPVNEPLLDGKEAEYVADCLRTGWISSAGRYIEAFEAQWAAYCGMKYGIAVCNGTAALDVAVGCLNLQPGDEVILPSFTIISCALAVVRHGGKPVLVDCDPHTWCMDVNQVEARITAKTRAIMPVHVYGHPVHLDPVLKLADARGLAIVEDAAEAHGAEYFSNHANAAGAWRRCGGFGHLSCFSFYANKIITTGEGGMVLTNDAAHAAKARSLRNLCFRSDRRFYHTELGDNYRMTNLQAAIGLAQLQRIDAILERKRWMGKAYTERLSGVPGLTLPVEMPWARSVYWMYGIVLDEGVGMDAAEFARKLKAYGVETRPFFFGMHEQPALAPYGAREQGSFPVTERIARYGLYLPSGLTLSEEQLDEVCAAVRRVMA